MFTNYLSNVKNAGIASTISGWFYLISLFILSLRNVMRNNYDKAGYFSILFIITLPLIFYLIRSGSKLRNYKKEKSQLLLRLNKNLFYLSLFYTILLLIFFIILGIISLFTTILLFLSLKSLSKKENLE